MRLLFADVIRTDSTLFTDMFIAVTNLSEFPAITLPMHLSRKRHLCSLHIHFLDFENGA